MGIDINLVYFLQVLKQCARLCIELGLVAGNVLFVDGTKIRANASTCKTYTKGYYEKQLQEVEDRIDDLLDECDIEELEKVEKLFTQRPFRNTCRNFNCSNMF